MERARQDVSDILGLKRGKVSVGAIPTVPPCLLPRVLPSFRRVYPNVTLSVREDLTSALVEQLIQGALDLALLSLPVSWGVLISERLLDEPMLLVVPRRHPFARQQGRPVVVGENLREPLLLMKEGHCFRDDVLQICKRFRVNPRVVFESGQLDTLVGMVAADAGVTLLPEMARWHFRRPGVKLLELRQPRPVPTLGIVRARDKCVTPSVRAFIKQMKDFCSL